MQHQHRRPASYGCFARTKPSAPIRNSCSRRDAPVLPLQTHIGKGGSMSAALQGHSEGDLEMVRPLLTRLGVAPEQLLSSSTRREQIPRLGVYIDRVAAAVTDGTRRAYSPYWMRAKAEWGERLLNEPTPLEIKQLAERTKVQAVIRRNSRGGRNAAEHMISA